MRRLHCVQTWAGRSQRQVGDQDAMRATPACKTPNLLSELPEIADLHARVCPQLLAVVLLMLSCFCLKQSSQACITLAEAFGLSRYDVLHVTRVFHMHWPCLQHLSKCLRVHPINRWRTRVFVHSYLPWCCLCCPVFALSNPHKLALPWPKPLGQLFDHAVFCHSYGAPADCQYHGSSCTLPKPAFTATTPLVGCMRAIHSAPGQLTLLRNSGSAKGPIKDLPTAGAFGAEP